MATRTTHFIHSSRVTGAQVLGAAFDLADVHDHDLSKGLPPYQQEREWYGILDYLHLQLTGAAASTKITIRISRDAAGDDVVVPDTEADLVAGVTTAATKCAAFSIGVPISQLGTASSLYVFAKVDAGTPTWAASDITWTE